MGILGHQPTVQEINRRLGIGVRTLISHLIALSKGKVDSKTGEWFYTLFLHEQPVNSVEEVREYLEIAWWVEEEDLKQELLYYIWQIQLSTYCELDYALARHLKDYLIYKERVFVRQNQWEARQITAPAILERKFEDIEILFEKNKQLNLFDRYLIYLSYILDTPIKDMEKILLLERRQIFRLLANLKSKLEDLDGAT
jgi:hypothetical protein